MSDAVTVVYQDLSADEKRVIFNDNRVARLRHGCAITDRQDFARIAEEWREKNEQQDALLRQALEALEWADNALYEGTPIQANTQVAITAIRQHLEGKQ